MPISDFSVDPPSLVRELTLSSDNTIHEYWSGCEFRCLSHLQLISKTRKDPADNGNNAKKVPEKFIFFFHFSNWVNHQTYTKEQKSILNSYITKIDVDTEDQQGQLLDITPFNCDTLCAEIALQTGLKMLKVKYYFKKVEDRFLIQKERRRKSELQKELAGMIPIANQSVGFKKRQRFGVQCTEAAQKMIKMPRLAVASPISIKRSAWTDWEDKYLVVLSAIGMNFMSGGHMTWKRLQEGLPHRKHTGFLKRRKMLGENGDLMSLYESACTIWPHFIREKLCSWNQSKDFLNRGNNLELKIRELMLELKEKAAEHQSNYMSISEPSTRMLLFPEKRQSVFDLTEMASGDIKTEQISDIPSRIESEVSALARILILNSGALCSRSIGKLHDLVPFTEKSIEIEKIKCMTKMFLVSPDESYDARQAYLLINDFSLIHREIAWAELNTENIVSRYSKGIERRIPGRSLQLSERLYLFNSVF